MDRQIDTEMWAVRQRGVVADESEEEEEWLWWTDG